MGPKPDAPVLASFAKLNVRLRLGGSGRRSHWVAPTPTLHLGLSPDLVRWPGRRPTHTSNTPPRPPCFFGRHLAPPQGPSHGPSARLRRLVDRTSATGERWETGPGRLRQPKARALGAGDHPRPVHRAALVSRKRPGEAYRRLPRACRATWKTKPMALPAYPVVRREGRNPLLAASGSAAWGCPRVFAVPARLWPRPYATTSGSGPRPPDLGAEGQTKGLFLEARRKPKKERIGAPRPLWSRNPLEEEWNKAGCFVCLRVWFTDWALLRVFSTF